MLTSNVVGEFIYVSTGKCHLTEDSLVAINPLRHNDITPTGKGSLIVEQDMKLFFEWNYLEKKDLQNVNHLF